MTYAPRLVMALPAVTAAGRTVKVYAILANPDDATTLPPAEWFRKQASELLSESMQPEDHPAGFLILHLGGDGDYMLVSQWYDANMLRHWVRSAPKGSEVFKPLTPVDLVACVWELKVILFERDAWVNTVLAAGRLDPQSLEAYHATTFSGWV